MNYKNEAQELIEDLYAFKRDKCQDLSLIDTMIEYAYKKDIPIQELGNTISEHPGYMKILNERLKESGYTHRNSRYKKDIKTGIKISEW